jgi:hypothetical protein
MSSLHSVTENKPRQEVANSRASTPSAMLNDKLGNTPPNRPNNRHPRFATVGHRTDATRPQRWNDAVAELLALQAEYAGWYEGLPGNLRDNSTGEALETILDLELDALAAIVPPRLGAGSRKGVRQRNSLDTEIPIQGFGVIFIGQIRKCHPERLRAGSIPYFS